MNQADRVVLFGIIAAVLIAVHYEFSFFYNIAIGFALGGSGVNFMFLYGELYHKKKKDENG